MSRGGVPLTAIAEAACGRSRRRSTTAPTAPTSTAAPPSGGSPASESTYITYLEKEDLDRRLQLQGGEPLPGEVTRRRRPPTSWPGEIASPRRSRTATRPRTRSRRCRRASGRRRSVVRRAYFTDEEIPVLFAKLDDGVYRGDVRGRAQVRLPPRRAVGAHLGRHRHDRGDHPRPALLHGRAPRRGEDRDERAEGRRHRRRRLPARGLVGRAWPPR